MALNTRGFRSYAELRGFTMTTVTDHETVLVRIGAGTQVWYYNPTAADADDGTDFLVTASGTGRWHRLPNNAGASGGGLAGLSERRYRANTAGTGYAVNDEVVKSVYTDGTTSSVIYWNETQSTIIAAAPTAGHLDDITAAGSGLAGLTSRRYVANAAGAGYSISDEIYSSAYTDGAATNAIWWNQTTRAAIAAPVAGDLDDVPAAGGGLAGLTSRRFVVNTAGGGYGLGEEVVRAIYTDGAATSVIYWNATQNTVINPAPTLSDLTMIPAGGGLAQLSERRYRANAIGAGYAINDEIVKSVYTDGDTTTTVWWNQTQDAVIAIAPLPGELDDIPTSKEAVIAWTTADTSLLAATQATLFAANANAKTRRLEFPSGVTADIYIHVDGGVPSAAPGAHTHIARVGIDAIEFGDHLSIGQVNAICADATAISAIEGV